MKRFASMLRVALRALRRNVLRTFLTMLGIIIGVGAVTAMVSIGTGAKVIDQMTARLRRLERGRRPASRPKRNRT